MDAASDGERSKRCMEALAAVPDAFQLVNNADVRRAGVKIGKVTSVTDTNGHSLVGFELQSGQAPVY